MDLNFSVFQEPRGVMRILQLVFSISAFAAICGFGGNVAFRCNFDKDSKNDFVYNYDYPFQLTLVNQELHPNSNSSCQVSIIVDFSSDARYFVATGVLAMLSTLGLIFVYAKFDNLYKTNNQIPLADFLLTVILAVLWLSCSAAWANGLTGLKHATDPTVILSEMTKTCPDQKCSVSSSGFSTLNISVVLGFLNFFLWAADLWFVYKETAWFQGNQGVTTSGV